MSRNQLIWILLTIGSLIGSYLPTLWGAGFLSISSVILSAVGGFAGIYLGFKLGD